MLRLTPQQKKGIDRLIQERIAEFQSRYLDPPEELCPLIWDGPRPTSALACMALLGAVLKVSENRYWESEKLVRWISNQCYKHQYEGKWNDLQKILENCSDYLEYRAFVTQEIMSQNDFFGNLENRIYTYIRLLEPKTEDNQRGTIKKPIRRRGYRDKGSQRPDWKRWTIFLLNDEREDRRSKVRHPLVGQSPSTEGPRDQSGPQAPTLREEVEPNA